MCDRRAPLRVLVLAGPGEVPDASRAVVERQATRRGVTATWRDVRGAHQLRTALRTAPDEADALVVLAGHLADDTDVAAEVAGCALATVYVDMDASTRRSPVAAACDRAVHGRGRRGLAAAIDLALTTIRHPVTTLAYGDAVDQVGDLRRPPGRDLAPVVVLVHGGFWLDPWERDLLDRLAAWLTAAGWATWNVGYRRVGPSGGGWPATLDDVCAAIDTVGDLAAEHRLRTDRTVLLGHSAGAQLAAYAAARARLPAAAPGAPLRRAPVGLVALAGVLHLAAAARQGLGDGAVCGFLGDPDVHADRYAVADPVGLVPLGIPTLLVHGTDDTLVPIEQSRTFATAVRAAGDEATLVEVTADHFAIVDPDGPVAGPLGRWLAARQGA